MQAEKAKKTHRRRNWLIFLIAWLLGHTAAWLIFYPISETNFIAQNNLLFYVTQGLILGSITSATQYLLIRWQFGRNIKYWIPVSVLAWLLTTLIPFQYFVESSILNGIREPLNIILLLLALLAPPALAQIWLLRKHVQQAWLWGLANIAVTVLFAMVIKQQSLDILEVALSYGLYSSATALILLWIFAMSTTPIKAEDTSSAEYRLSEPEQETIRLEDSQQQGTNTRYL